MAWRFWRKKQSPTDVAGLAYISMERRLLALEQAMDIQRTMLDERTRVMADAIATEFRAVGRIMADLAQSMAQLDARLAAQMQAVEQRAAEEPSRPRSLAAQALAKPSAPSDDELAPPPAANDPPTARVRAVDPLLLDSLAKGRVAFDITRISSIPPRSALLAMMRFAPPLPPVDSAIVDRVAELFPDAALLLDRFMMDAATSMVQRGQAPTDLPLLVPLSPITARDAAFPADFHRRFDRLNHSGGVFPLLSETGWIGLVEAQAAASPDTPHPKMFYAVRASGERRVDPAALAGWGVRYLLAPASVLASPDIYPLAPDIHAADVARLFSRAGIGLVAEDVPDHVTVLGLLRNNVGMGWGPAFQGETVSSAISAPAADAAEPQDYRSYLRRAGS